nr:VTT domain-containing protein [Bacilli bacterium]
MKRLFANRRTILLLGGSFLIGIALVFLFYRFDRDLSPLIHRLGFLGIFATILLMAIMSVIPFPSEFFMIIAMQIYGVWLGILYVWLGAMLGAYASFWIAKHFQFSFIQKKAKSHHLTTFFHLVDKYGAVGLLIARLIPFIPFIVFNYACALLPEVTTVRFLWTTGVGILPYDLGAALIFLGVAKRTLIWLIIGAIALLAIMVTAILVAKRQPHAIKSS